MKYTFEVSTTDTGYTVKIDIAYGSGINNVVRFLSFEDGADGPDQDIEQQLNDMVDNMRLTVDERKEARWNITRFLSYVQWENENKKKGMDDDKTQQLILEGI